MVAGQCLSASKLQLQVHPTALKRLLEYRDSASEQAQAWIKIDSTMLVV
jgi:hypothetical protein